MINDRPTRLIVNLDALLRNYEKLNNLSDKKVGLAIVKANSYGLGSKVISKLLYENGVRHFAVATFEEALELKEVIKESLILVLGVTNPKNVKYAVENNISLTCPSKEWLEEAIKELDSITGKLKVHVKIETGMNRIGTFEEKEILEKLDKNKDVVNLVNFFEENSTIYLVLEYFEGINLKKYVLENELPEKEILQIFLEIVKIVIEIHDECVIHRDIKPSNILINGKNEIKIIDFGTGLLKGNRNGDYIKVTEGYSALEMYSLKTEIDDRSDVYSLCALLYFMLEKKKLKRVLDRFYSEELTFERKINEDLKRIMEKGLAIHRKERYSSCLEIYSEILKYIEKFENLE